MKCRHCGSENLTFTKHIHYGDAMGTSYHFRTHCGDCKKSYHIKKNKEVYEKVKNKDWIKSRGYLRKFGDDRQGLLL